MYESQEISRVSKNLSLRLSPERKYGPKITSCPICYCCPCKCCSICHYLPCRCCRFCHCCPCSCIIHSPLRYRASSPIRTSSPIFNKTYSPNRNFGQSSNLMGSTNFSTYHSPTRLRNPNTGFSKYNYNDYEQRQFNDFLKKLMMIESQIEKIKIDLSLNPDFNCEDAFRLFELDGRGYLKKKIIKIEDMIKKMLKVGKNFSN